MKTKIAVITGSRAEYGLLFPLIKEIENNGCFDMELIAAGNHLSEKHGMTINQIKEDKINVSHVIDMTPEGDKETDICNAISTGIQEFSQLYASESYDLIIVLGDRHELLAACTAALIHRVPIAHIHGGEVTEGAIDDSIRNSITKMASLHFVSMEQYRKRVIQMGENPDRVHKVGALGIDNIKNTDFLSRDELEIYVKTSLKNDFALLTYHPVTQDDYQDAETQMKEVLEALLEFDMKVITTMPNTDVGGNLIYSLIKKYVDHYPEKFHLVKNLGQRRYLSMMNYASFMIGNSSSGIIEAASFKLPVVNIGDRQSGRYKAKNIIDCICIKENIEEAIIKALSKEFRQDISDIQNPYGDGKTAERILKILKSVDFSNKAIILKKGFYDLQ